jgi:glycosyltransferase involved in cell wall biosynthesis
MPTIQSPQKAASPIRVLHSFPHRLGMSRICTTAWHEIDSSTRAGAQVTVMCGDSVRPFKQEVKVIQTLSKGSFRIPRKLVGVRRLCALHDWMVARSLPALRNDVDIVHAWPLAAVKTIQVAKQLGIPVAIERCNAHTRYAYDSVQQESDRLGIKLPPNFEHAFNQRLLEIEELEYESADALLCPSDFVVKSFLDQGFARSKLKRFIYGVDTNVFIPESRQRPHNRPFTMIFAGICAVRKGLHFALKAWLQSEACINGRFIIAGSFLPDYQKILKPMLAHPSVEQIGNRSDLPVLMRESDLFVLPSIEEGFGLVCTEAMASGCVPLVSEACTEICSHMQNSLVHKIGDIHALSHHIDLLFKNPDLLKMMRQAGILNRSKISWDAAGVSLANAYRDIRFNS